MTDIERARLWTGICGASYCFGGLTSLGWSLVIMVVLFVLAGIAQILG